jgi:hypothetical protein
MAIFNIKRAGLTVQHNRHNPIPSPAFPRLLDAFAIIWLTVSQRDLTYTIAINE